MSQITVDQAAPASIGRRGLRGRLAAQEALVGTFIKTSSHQTVEILGGCGLDFAVIDAEHAPFGRESMDLCCMAARSVGLPALVRTASAAEQGILQALDLGAAGVLVPHVDSAASAAAVVSASRYRQADGTRGYSNSPRAGGYGRAAMQAHIDASDQAIAVLVQVESAAAVDAVEQIAGVAGVDALFVGRADLAVSYQVDDLLHPRVQAAVERICRAGRDKGVAVGIFLPDATEVGAFRALGVSLFLIGSDQSFLRQMAAKIVQDSKLASQL